MLNAISYKIYMKIYKVFMLVIEPLEENDKTYEKWDKL
jgi:hypothetical protein